MTEAELREMLEAIRLFRAGYSGNREAALAILREEGVIE